MGELTDIVKAAVPALMVSHIAVTTVRAYYRYDATKDFYMDRSFLQRLPRCFKRRVFKPETIGYSACLATLGVLAYYIFQKI
jgi:hypothetical protein